MYVVLSDIDLTASLTPKRHPLLNICLPKLTKQPIDSSLPSAQAYYQVICPPTGGTPPTTHLLDGSNTLIVNISTCK